MDEEDEDIRLALLQLACVHIFVPQQLSSRLTGDYHHIDNNEDNHAFQPSANEKAAEDFCNWLLHAPDTMFNDLFRLKKAVFFDLCRWLRINVGAEGNRRQSLEQKVMVFLWICAYNEPQRNTAYRFRMHQSTVSRIFHELIKPMNEAFAYKLRSSSGADICLAVC